MKTRKKRKRTGISLLLILTAVSAFADSRADTKVGAATTRTIEGRVLNSQGASVPGAVVLLKDSKTLQVRSYIAQTNGTYHFFGLSTEVNYTLRAEDHGMTSKQKTVSVFDSHREVKLDLKLSQEIKRPAKQPSKQ
jgi:hypothetical protein